MTVGGVYFGSKLSEKRDKNWLVYWLEILDEKIWNKENEDRNVITVGN